jgi:hypothetical protein
LCLYQSIWNKLEKEQPSNKNRTIHQFTNEKQNQENSASQGSTLPQPWNSEDD